VIFHKEFFVWELKLWQHAIALDADVMAAMPTRAPRVIADPLRPALKLFSQSLVRPPFFERDGSRPHSGKKVKSRAAKAIVMQDRKALL